ncbi:MAG: NAD(P)H-dependent oxidoreductase [Clostridiaceae bacterium]|nr:NAD(P)H-dependent oxidoreductase [Clostridiaceae bacterium]
MDREETLKKLVVYYSFEGNTKYVAETIAETTGADLLELKLEKEISSKGAMKYFWGGAQVLMKKKPNLRALDKNPQEYDIIFIGTPVWAWTFAPPLNTFFSNVKLKGKKIALFSCNRGQNGKTFRNMKTELENNDIVGTIDFFDPLLNNKEENRTKTKNWAQEIVSSI